MAAQLQLTAPAKEQPVRALWRSLTANRKVALGIYILVFFSLVALVWPMLIRQHPNAFSLDILEGPSARHWLGTTQTGQDVFAQVIVGTRVSLLLGFITGVVTTLISVFIGLVSGYFGGLIDEVLSLFSNVF